MNENQQAPRALEVGAEIEQAPRTPRVRDEIEQGPRSLQVDDEIPQTLRSLHDDGDLPDLLPAATEAGLVDVAYVTHDSPVGTLLLATTDRGLVRIAYLDGATAADAVLDQLARQVSPRVLLAPASLDRARRELDDYFAQARDHFDLSIDWRLTGGFARRVLKATARIPYGSVSTYKGVAAQAGSPRGYRAAGNALGANPLPIVVPCHRVLHASGGLGGYTGGLERKRLLLGVEGLGP